MIIQQLMLKYLRKYFQNTKQSIPYHERLVLSYIVKQLPEKYAFMNLIEQVESSLITGKTYNSLGKPFTYTFLLRDDMVNDFEQKMPLLLFTNIKLRSKLTTTVVDLHINNSVLVSYYTTTRLEKLEAVEVDTSQMQVRKRIMEQPAILTQYLSTLPEAQRYQLDINDSFTIDCELGIFYTVKDLKDGDYLAISERGELYHLSHDPYQAESVKTLSTYTS